MIQSLTPLEQPLDYSPGEMARLKRKYSSWSIQGHIVYRTEDPEEVREVLHIETLFYARPYNRIRLYQRYCKGT